MPLGGNDDYFYIMGEEIAVQGHWVDAKHPKLCKQWEWGINPVARDQLRKGGTDWNSLAPASSTHHFFYSSFVLGNIVSA